jgi:hypothetical protein
VHIAAASVWIGGLAGLLIVLGTLPSSHRGRCARRYSTAAAVALVALAVSGTLRALDEIGTWHQLLATGFGQLVIAKIVLLAVLAGLGALNRYRHLPAVGPHPRRLRTVGSAELAIAAVVLVATAVLVNLAPARSATAAAKPPAPAQLAIDAHDFATTVRVHLTVSPGTAGFNQFRLSVVDYDTSAPIDGATVSIRFALPARPDLGQSTLPLGPSGPGVYTAPGANLAIDGTWNLDVLVQQPAGSTEVPITLTTRQVPQRIDVQHNTGLPDVFTLHISGNRSVQTYLDPGHPGALNEFHTTFIGADGNETAVDTLAVTAIGPTGGPPATLEVRKLDPVGHFVADLPSPRAGRYTFDITGHTPQGETIHGVFTIAVT